MKHGALRAAALPTKQYVFFPKNLENGLYRKVPIFNDSRLLSLKLKRIMEQAGIGKQSVGFGIQK